MKQGACLVGMNCKGTTAREWEQLREKENKKEKGRGLGWTPARQCHCMSQLWGNSDGAVSECSPRTGTCGIRTCQHHCSTELHPNSQELTPNFTPANSSSAESQKDEAREWSHSQARRLRTEGGLQAESPQLLAQGAATSECHRLKPTVGLGCWDKGSPSRTVLMG